MKLEECIFKRWIHSKEEDVEGQTVYRTTDYKFPLSRGRQSFEFKKNGEFIRYDIGPVDAPQIIKGYFKIEGQNKISIHFEDPSIEPYTLEIISYERNILRIKS